jgi:AcrR family transcriptional regulator
MQMKSTRDNILETAKRAFSEYGYRGASLDKIAQELNITRQALYHYFPRKIDVLIELNRQMIQIFHQNADRALAETHRAGDDDAFTALIRAHLTTVAENLSLVAVFLKESFNVPASDNTELAALRRAYQDRFITAYQAGVRQGRLRDVDARVAVNLMLGAANQLFQWYSPKGDFPPDKIPEVIVDLLRFGFGSESSRETDRRTE